MKLIDIILLLLLFAGLLYIALKVASSLARYEARLDKASIDAGEDVKHSGSMIRNGSILLVMSCVLVLVVVPPINWWSLVMLVGCFLMLATEFGVSFMGDLNALRKHHRYYVSPTSDIDWFFIKHRLNWANKDDYRRRVIDSHAENYATMLSYRNNIHAAGKALMVTEAVLFIIGALMALASIIVYIRMS